MIEQCSGNIRENYKLSTCSLGNCKLPVSWSKRKHISIPIDAFSHVTHTLLEMKNLDFN